MNKKLFLAKDVKEILESLEYDIYKELIEKANALGNYQAAVDAVQERLRKLIQVTPHNRRFIERAAQNAGERFLKVVNEVKHQHEKANMGILSSIKFGNITITQHPPNKAGEIEYPGELQR